MARKPKIDGNNYRGGGGGGGGGGTLSLIIASMYPAAGENVHSTSFSPGFWESKF